MVQSQVTLVAAGNTWVVAVTSSELQSSKGDRERVAPRGPLQNPEKCYLKQPIFEPCLPPDHQVARTSTYFHQLEAFRDAIVDGTPFPTTADDGVRNMEIIDACYRAAGLQPRPTA